MPTPYVALSDMSDIPLRTLVEALDDDGDGQADSGAWAKVAASVAQEIDGILGARYPVPFTNPIPARVCTAAQILAGEKLFVRRGFSDEQSNPFAKRAKEQRAILESIAKGDVPLTPEIKRAAPSVSAITEPAPTTSGKGRRMA